MNMIHETFGRASVVLPVVHCINERQVRENVDIAIREGADGVFLINQGGMDALGVASLARAISRDLPTEWACEKGVRVRAPFVGINLLGDTDLAIAKALEYNLSAIWTDNYQSVDPPGREQLASAGVLHFGGTAFKYQHHVSRHQLPDAAEFSSKACDVVTTSGDRTGEPPTIDKIQLMRMGVEKHALGIASGITPENVNLYLAHTDAFLVATGIEVTFGYLDPVKVRTVVTKAHARRLPS